MEPLDLIAAKLVLGYLRSAKCKIAQKEFLKTSFHLRHLDYSKTKYMPTRFLGQTLEDILVEYFQISQIIQGRLEATNFYNEHNSKTSLQEQLLYLLNNKVPLSCASTPIASTPYGSSGNYMSPNHSDLEATPVHTLPGNAESEDPFNLNASPIRKLNSRSERHSPSPPRMSPLDKSQTEVFDTELLAQNLMDNKEFQEKIAQTINKVVERQYRERNSGELDKTIKCAVEEAQADPIFEDLLREIMGSSNILEASKNSELVNTTTSSKEKKKDYLDIDTSGSNNKSDQVQSDTQDLNVSQPVRPDKEFPQKPITMLQPILSYENTFDNYVISNNCNLVSSNACVPNSVFINTLTGLLIPSVPTTTVNSTKPLILLNKPALATAPMALTEYDIMKMPIILNENDGVTPDAVETGKQKIEPEKPKMLLPKTTIQLASDNLTNYFKNYAPPENLTIGEDSSALVNEEASASSVVPTEITSKKKTGLKKVIYPKALRKSPRPMKRAIPTSQLKKADLVQPTEAVITESNQNENQDVAGSSNSPEKIVTPVPSVNDKKPTPKSSSHVRNLDFSTPPKSRRKSDGQTTQKTQAVKTLFIKAWDAELRAIIPEQDNKDLASKTQRMSSGSKKTRKKTKTNTYANDIEREGLLLEAAIKTPFKHRNTENMSETECLDDDNKILKSQVKTILSPSKLPNITKKILETKSDETNKIVTPDMPKENVIQHVAANRNITPMLETPIKIQLPKTPGISTPIDINVGNISTTTPFTKMLEANLDLKGIDIGSLPTPNLPITPSFAPFTPTVDLISPYSNRPTDYSTGSSYYQPSDNEQNKNLEAHLREIEKVSTEVTLNDHLQIFNKNVIGKKNLNLMKTNMEDYRSLDSSSNEEDSSSDECNKESNDTVIFKKKNDTPRRTYPLRNRTKSVVQPHSAKIPIKSKTSVKVAKVSKKEIKKSTESENICLTTTNVEEIANILHESEETVISKPTVKGVTPSQLSVLKDLENKRLRMVNSLKPQVQINKTPNSKFKIKPIAKVFTTKKNRKSDSPKKKKKIRDIDIVLKDLITSDDSDINISLSEEDKMEDKLLTIDKGDKTASDVEAQNLIEGLKERGIHLMHNKSPKKKHVDGEIESNTGGTQLEMFDRDSFDMVNLDECIVITYNEEENKSKKAPTALEDKKKLEYIGKLYLESIGSEIEIRLTQTNFHSLIDIKSNDKHKLPSINTKNNQTKTDKNKASGDTKKKRRRSNENETNDLKKYKKESKSKSKNETIRTETKQAESTQCSNKTGDIELNGKQSTEYKKIQHGTSVSESNSKNETKSKKTELIENKKEKQIKDVKKKKGVDNKPKQLIDKKSDKHPLKKTTTDTDDKNYQKQSFHKGSMINKPLQENTKEIKKQNCTEVKQMSEHKKTKQNSKEKQTSEIKKDEQIPESKTQLLYERAEKKTSENEKIKQDRMNTENKDRLAGTNSICNKSYSSDKDSNLSGVHKDIEDELMNFASTGKEQDGVSSKSVSKKRRLSDEILTEHSCKKMLKTLDVDSFLNKIHADTSIAGRK